MSKTIFGAFRTDTTLSDSTVTYSNNSGDTFQITAYSSITISDGADATIIDGDDVVNETPNDPTQTYNGNAIAWDYTMTVNDGVNNYEIGVMDYDSNGSGSFDYPTSEQGYFIVFLGDVPPLNTTLTVGSIIDNGPNIDVDTPVPCFTTGTMIETAFGPRRVETLKPGDLVLTLDHGAQTVRWIGTRSLSTADLAKNPKLRPIRIAAGALGNGLPKRDLCVSPQHRMLVRSPIVRRMFNTDEVLLPAAKLVGLPGIEIDQDAAETTYVHVLFDSHEIVFAEDAPTESLFTGQQALNAVGGAARKEIFTLFPELASKDYAPTSARVLPQKGKQIRTLVRRHADNEKPLLAA